MRQMLIQVPKGQGGRAVQLAEKYDGINIVKLEGIHQNEIWDLVIAHVSNRKISNFLKDLGQIDDVHMTLNPQGVFPMTPPGAKVPQEVSLVEPRSPTEVWLNGQQSIGSWKGFLGYAITASVVIWIGMITNTSYLLVAAMILAPFASPAMNVALASATGDKDLLWRSLLRYFVALIVMISLSALMSLLTSHATATQIMVSVANVSSVAFLLPLVAGAAGALNLVQSENNSLVSGTVVGLLVASSLTPPAALIGMSAVIGRWDLVTNGVFILAIQLIGINIASALVFRFYGLKPEGARYERGVSWLFYASLAASIILSLGLLIWQFSNPPAFQRSSTARQAVDVVQQSIEESDLAIFIDANASFPRPKNLSQNTLLLNVVAQKEETSFSDEEVREELTRRIRDQILAQFENVIPLINLTLLDPPPLSNNQIRGG